MKVIELEAVNRDLGHDTVMYIVHIPEEYRKPNILLVPPKHIESKDLSLITHGVRDLTDMPAWVIKYKMMQERRSINKLFAVGEPVITLIDLGDTTEVEEYNQPDYDEV